jgi:predicted DNA-binding helix-hairpin-helix protein
LTSFWIQWAKPKNPGLKRIAKMPYPTLENMHPLDYTRYVRIYQASFLLRDYGFDLEEMPFLADGNLPLGEDPKMIWAMQHYGDSPVEINKLSREELIRLPGIGKIGAERIYNVRKQQKITSLHQLEAAGVGVSRLAPFVLINGHRVPQQLPLWKTNPSISSESPSK